MKKENRITLPPHIRERATQRVNELNYNSVLEYLCELVVVDTSPLIARAMAEIPQAPPQQPAPPPVETKVTASAGSGWGEV